ncbi:MAG TPA: GNAT family N-acetyltransferase [Roseiflexaceae bacterium]|nr:GNAT family N-acetyltransferase [Roseiflexaceae bacterium]
MVMEIALDQLGAHSDDLLGPHTDLVVRSAMAGNSAARLWTIEQSGGRPIRLLWDQGNNVLYLAGQLIAEAAQGELSDLIQHTIRPQAIEAGLAYFKTRALAPSAESALLDLFQGIALRELPSLFYGLDRAHAAPAVEGIRLLPIDRALLANAELANAEHVRAEIRWMWPSEERFYDHGFGWAALAEQQIVCWCTAEYVSADRCGIGITTVAEYERRGIATATAGRFVERAFRRGLRPYWECRADNPGSIRVAEKLGFELLARERYWAGIFHD